MSDLAQSLGQDQEVGVQPEEQDYLFVGCFFFKKIHLQQTPANLLAQMQPANNKITCSHAQKNFNLTLDISIMFQAITACNFQHNHPIQSQAKLNFFFHSDSAYFIILRKPKTIGFGSKKKYIC